MVCPTCALNGVHYVIKYFMGLFDLLFIVLFLATVAMAISAAVLAIRGRRARALALLRGWLIGAAAYIGLVAVTSLFWPRRVSQIGEQRCFDDWCITVENATRRPVGSQAVYTVNLRVSSTARRVTQRELGVVVYLTDDRGRRYDAVPDKAELPFSMQLGPGDSAAATRVFEVPGDAQPLGLVIAHEGGFPIGWFILGYETWFHKPTIVRLP